MSLLKASLNLGTYQAMVDQALAELDRNRIMARIWARDHTVWKPEPAEIANRLGWLDSPHGMAEHLPEVLDLAKSIRGCGVTQVLLLGMGGSSLAPEVFRKTFGVRGGFPDLAILDSTDPGAILSRSRALDPAGTLFVVSTKSGGTVETFSFLKFFYNRMAASLGREKAGRHFVAITDPGSGLADTARALDFLHIFYNDPDIGGRYSALSYFGLAPAALIGLDLQKFLTRAAAEADAERAEGAVGGFRAATLGTILGELAKAGRNKLTLLFSKEIESFGDWLEQLIAESTGKEGRGIVPIVGEPLGPPEVYGPDRLFVEIRLAGDRTGKGELERLAQAGHPVLRLELDDLYDLGAQCFLWELATAVAGARLGINPFDQPDVEAAKIFTRQMVARFLEQGALPEETEDYAEGDFKIYGQITGNRIGEIVSRFLGSGNSGDYVAIQAYLQPTRAVDEALQRLRLSIRDRCRLAATVGYGPRFLHSTGQLHKGDAGQGLFLQITADDPEDAPIPDEAGSEKAALTFGILKNAQARGDRRALTERGRRVMRLHIRGNLLENLRRL